MPYIAFDLDALKHVPDGARAAGISEAAYGYGLVRLWAFCWTEKTELVTDTHLRGFFGGDAGPALLAFGHLALSDGAYRVRGAEKYLRISEAKSKGGHAAKANLVPGYHPKGSRSHAGVSAGDPAGALPEVEPEMSTGRTPALTPSTEHRAPSTESKKLAPASRAPRESDELCAVFLEVTGSKYLWQGAKDGTAFARLRKEFSLEEILARWRKALGLAGWKQAASVAQLAQKWNDLAVSDTDVRKGYLDGNRGEGENTARVVHGGST